MNVIVLTKPRHLLARDAKRDLNPEPLALDNGSAPLHNLAHILVRLFYFYVK